MPEPTVFWLGVVTGAFVLAAVELCLIVLLCRQAKPMDEEAGC